jgi:hypothetical protein
MVMAWSVDRLGRSLQDLVPNRSPTWPCLTASIRAHVWHARRRAPLACVYGCRRISAHRSFIELPTKLSVRARRYATTEVENAALA